MGYISHDTCMQRPARVFIAIGPCIVTLIHAFTQQELVELSPSHSMRVLLEDNVVLGNPSMQRSHDYWSAQVMCT